MGVTNRNNFIMSKLEIKSEIVRRGIKASWIAKKMGVTRGALTNWLNGNHPISEERLEEIVSILNTKF